MPLLRTSLSIVLLLVSASPPALERYEIYAGDRQRLTIPLSPERGRSLVVEAARPWLRQTVPLAARPAALALVGDHLLMAVGRRLEIHAAIQPLAGRPVATLGLSFAPRFLVATASHAILVGADRFVVVDISDMRRPRPLAERQIPGGAVSAVAMDDDGRLFMATAEGRLNVFDVSLPAAPEALGQQALGLPVGALAASADRLYVAAGREGVAIYDTGDAAAIVRLGRYRTTGPAVDLVVDGDVVYVASGAWGITLLDVGDPEHPLWLGSHQQVGDVRRLRLQGDRLMTLGIDGRFGILDVGRPSMPSIVASARLPASVHDLLPAARSVYLLSDDALSLVDTDVEPPEIGNEGLDFGQGVNLGGQRRAAVRDGLLYVADWFSGIHVYDIRGTVRPRLLSSLHTPGSPKGICLDGDYAYVADDDHGLEVVDVSDPSRPRLVARLQTSGLAYTPVVVGQRLYLASHRGGFQIVDITDPSSPRLVASVDTPGKAWSIRVRDGIAYVADDENGLLVFDLADEGHPRLLARYSPGGAVEDVVIDGDIAYLALFEGGLHVLDIRRPEAPRRVARLPLPGNARGLELDGDRLFVAGWLAGVHEVDVRDRRHPRLLSSYDTPGAAWGVRVVDGRAYVLDWWGGLSVVDVSVPARPRGLARYPASEGRVRRLAVAGDYAFVAYGQAGFQVFDIRNPLNPTWITGLDLGDARDLAVDGGRAYVLDGRRRVHVVRIDDPFAIAEQGVVELAADPGQIVAVRGLAYLTDASGHLAVLDPDSGVVAPVAGERDIVDLWQDGHRLVATTSAGEVRVYSLADPARPVVDHRYPVPAGVSQARLLAGRAFVYAPGVGYAPLVAPAGGRPAPLFGVAGGMRDIQGDGRSTLFALGEDGTILQIDASGAEWRPVVRYRPLQPATAMTFHRGVLYLAGGAGIVALRTLGEVTVDPGAGGVRLGVPPDLPLGDYLLLLEMAGADAGTPRLLHVRRRPYGSRPSAEALRRLVAEHRRRQASGDAGE